MPNRPRPVQPPAGEPLPDLRQPTRDGGFRGWWKRRHTWQQASLIVVAFFVLAGAVSSISSAGDNQPALVASRSSPTPAVNTPAVRQCSTVIAAGAHHGPAAERAINAAAANTTEANTRRALDALYEIRDYVADVRAACPSGTPGLAALIASADALLRSEAEIMSHCLSLGWDCY